LIGPRFAVGTDQPASVLRLAQKRRETGIRVETWHAQPVDRAVTPDQRRRMAIADQCVILDPHQVPAAARSTSQITSPCGLRRPAGMVGSPARARVTISRFAAPLARKTVSRLDSSAGYVSVMRGSRR